MSLSARMTCWRRSWGRPTHWRRNSSKVVPTDRPTWFPRTRRKSSSGGPRCGDHSNGCFQSVADRFRTQLADWYGQERAGGVKTAEAFELCEYGRQPNKAELAELFPFFAPP